MENKSFPTSLSDKNIIFTATERCIAIAHIDAQLGSTGIQYRSDFYIYKSTDPNVAIGAFSNKTNKEYAIDGCTVFAQLDAGQSIYYQHWAQNNMNITIRKTIAIYPC